MKSPSTPTVWLLNLPTSFVNGFGVTLISVALQACSIRGQGAANAPHNHPRTLAVQFWHKLTQRKRYSTLNEGTRRFVILPRRRSGKVNLRSENLSC